MVEKFIQTIRKCFETELSESLISFHASELRPVKNSINLAIFE